jgi:hypothetical protein
VFEREEHKDTRRLHLYTGSPPTSSILPGSIFLSTLTKSSTSFHTYNTLLSVSPVSRPCLPFFHSIASTLPKTKLASAICSNSTLLLDLSRRSKAGLSRQ